MGHSGVINPRMSRMMVENLNVLALLAVGATLTATGAVWGELFVMVAKFVDATPSVDNAAVAASRTYGIASCDAIVRRRLLMRSSFTFLSIILLMVAQRRFALSL